MKATIKTIISVAFLLGNFSTCFAQQAYTKENYESAKKNAEAVYDKEIKSCDALKDNAKDVCILKAKAQRIHTTATAEAHYKKTPKATKSALIDIADADYKVAKELCDDQKDNAKDICLKDAKAKHVSAVADAKAGKATSDAIQEANEDKNDANYKLEKEKCDALSGAQKDECEQKIKQTFKK